MSEAALFCHLTTKHIAEMVLRSQKRVCYAAPGIGVPVAKAMVEVAKRLGPEWVSVSLDFDERVLRMGYGAIEAVDLLRKEKILINSSPGLRSGLVIIDDVGYIFTPTALYLEAEPLDVSSRNALKLSPEQLTEAMARLSPAAKAIATASAVSDSEKKRIENLPLEVGADTVSEEDFKAVDEKLKEAPPVPFDVARQVRVYEAYLQYVELQMTGAAIQRHRLQIPKNILDLGGNKSLEGRLRTTFDLINKDSALSSKHLEDSLNEIRKNFTRSLGKDHGRVVLNSVKEKMEERLRVLAAQLKQHQTDVKAKLEKSLEKSRKDIVKYYAPIVKKSPPDALFGQIAGKVTLKAAEQWLDDQLKSVFPSADSLIKDMKLEWRFKDVTFETLIEKDFLQTVKDAFPHVDWDKPHKEFLAASESRTAMQTKERCPS